MKKYGRAAALALLTLTILFSFADAQRNTQPPKKTTDELTGWVMCSVCGGKPTGVIDGSRPNTPAHADCMHQCVDKGADIDIMPDAGDTVVQIENPTDLKSHFAQRVVVDGYWNDQKFHILSIRNI